MVMNFFRQQPKMHLQQSMLAKTLDFSLRKKHIFLLPIPPGLMQYHAATV